MEKNQKWNDKNEHNCYFKRITKHTEEGEYKN